ncbi:MAG: ZmpA/ZmpB/ZmpC family metallo-endopeptidase, partial [Corynebacterium sp.]|nr:ZmpA/ZmpB/ZmpC family metallo-endopeptidase [Corynebacterium sp.]
PGSQDTGAEQPGSQDTDAEQPGTKESTGPKEPESLSDGEESTGQKPSQPEPPQPQPEPEPSQPEPEPTKPETPEVVPPASTTTGAAPTTSTTPVSEPTDTIATTAGDSSSKAVSFDNTSSVEFYGTRGKLAAAAAGSVAKLTASDGAVRYVEVAGVSTAANGNTLVTLKQADGGNYADNATTVEPGAVLELDKNGGVVDNLARHADYDADLASVYKNLRAIGPWVDTARIVANAKELSSSKLATKEITALLPVTTGGAKRPRVLMMDAAGAASVDGLKVVYADGSNEIYSAHFAGASDEIANFDVTIDGTTVRYQYSGVYLQNGLSAYASVISRAKNLDASQLIADWDLAPDRALLRENYNGLNGNDGFKAKRLERMLSTMIASQPQCVALDGVAAMGTLRDCSFLYSKLNDTIRHLNWLDRAFDFDMGGTRLADWLAASPNADMLGAAPSADYVIDRSTHYQVKNKNATGKMSYRLGSLQYAGYRLRYIYDDIVKGGSGRTILEYLISHYTDEGTDYDAWLKNNFDGLIIQPQVGKQVSPWEQLSRFAFDMRDRRYEKGMSIPAFMSTHAPQMYMAVLPGYIIFGNGQAYASPANQDQRKITWEELPGELQPFINKLAGWLENVNGVIPGFIDRLDKELYRVWDAPYKGAQSNYTDTDDPMLHRFGWIYNGRINEVAFTDDHAAHRADDYVFFGRSAFLYNYATVTHEFTHAMDGGPMFNYRGRRTDGGNTEIGAESFAAGMFEQSFGMGNMAPNWSGDGFGDWTSISNYSASRINTPEGFQSYYAGLFDVLYTLEYAMGQAFLTLDTNTQKQLALTTEPIGGGGGAAGRVTGYYGYDGKADLKTMEDLWDKHVVIRPAIPRNDYIRWNDYAAVGSIDTMWYVPNNDLGFSDSQSFKLQAFMMAAANGWDGMSAVISGRKTDAQAIREATNGQYTSWKQFKLAQWDRVAREVPQDQMNALIAACEKALKNSPPGNEKYAAQNTLRNKIILGAKTQTNDFLTSYTTVDYKGLLE